MFTIASESGKKKGFIDGYTDLEKHSSPNMLAPPSKNCYIDQHGVVRTRPGYLDTGWDLAEANKSPVPFYVKRWNVTFFSLNGKVKFVDHDNQNTVQDTGLSLTATETTTFGEYVGDIYCTNQTDGLRQIHMGRVNETAANSGDANITVDQHLAGRLIAFADTSGTLRIANTSSFTESYASVAATGVITLSNTLNADVPDNTIIYTVEDISANRPKGSHLTFWKERMIVWGVIGDQNTYNATVIDMATNVVYMSKFALRDVIENIIDFDTSGTAAIEQVGKGGAVTEILPTRDYLYIFTDSETYFSGVADVNATTGDTLPQLLTNQHGCLAAGMSLDLGNGKIAFVTSQKRIMGIGISTESGAAVVFPIEGFDSPMKETLKDMNDTQTNASAFYAKSRKWAFFNLRINNSFKTLVYDNTIEKWLPPWENYIFTGYFEKDGTLFSSAYGDDTVYEIGEFGNDNGIDINTVAATGRFQFEDGRVMVQWKEIELSGEMTYPTSPVGGVTGRNTSITSSGLDFGDSGPLSEVLIGEGTIAGELSAASQFAEWDVRKAIYPQYGGDVKITLSSTGDGAAFKWSSFRILGRVLKHSAINLS